MAAAGVEVHLGSQVDRAMIVRESPDVVVMAMARFLPADFASEGALQIADAWQILSESVEPDFRVWSIGAQIGSDRNAERLRKRARVRLAVSGIAVGESLPFYVRDASVASLHNSASACCRTCACTAATRTPSICST